MAAGWFQNLAIAFALVTGTGAGLLSALMWEIFRRTLFGRAVFALLSVMSVFIVYHVVLLTVSDVPLAAEVLESVAFTGIAAFIALLIHTQRRMGNPERETA